MKTHRDLEEIRADYNWQEAFGCVGEPGRCNSGIAHPTKPCEGLIDPRAVTLADVAEVIAVEEGEHDGPDWVGVFKTRDGLYLTLRAGCDYTGWDCQSGGSGEISTTLAHAVEFGLSDDERSRLHSQLTGSGHGGRGRI